MTQRIYHLFGIALLVVTLASCSSSKMLKKSHSIDGMSEVEYVENLIVNTNDWNALTAKMSLSLDLGGKESVTKVNGTLRVKKGEVIQLSIAPFLGIEVGRAEISPDGILVIDRMNKRYVEVPFAEVKILSNADLDFSTLQALFLNSIFLPGKDELVARDASAFRVIIVPSVIEPKAVVVSISNTPLLAFSFLYRYTNPIITLIINNPRAITSNKFK
mgnify:CR=1 FL=1